MGGEAHHGKRRGTFIQRTIDALHETMERSLYAEHTAEGRGFLQTLDPRVKVVSVLAIIVTAAAARHLDVVAVIAGLTLVLIVAGRIQLSALRPVWIGMFVFSGLIAAPAIFLTPGPSLATVPWLGWSVSAYGLRSAALLVMRSELSITYSVVLVMTTPWNHILKSFRVLGVPTLAVVIMGMTYRYIFLMLQTASDMFEARQARMVGTLDDATSRRLASATVGVLLSKSFQLSNDVYLAMQSRGYRGDVYALDDFALKTTDYVAIPLVTAAVAVGLWYGAF
jgi:cobalt/nickel transport system permease protein